MMFGAFGVIVVCCGGGFAFGTWATLQGRKTLDRVAPPCDRFLAGIEQNSLALAEAEATEVFRQELRKGRFAALQETFAKDYGGFKNPKLGGVSFNSATGTETRWRVKYTFSGEKKDGTVTVVLTNDDKPMVTDIGIGTE